MAKGKSKVDDINKLAEEWYQLYRIILNTIAHSSIELPLINYKTKKRTGKNITLVGIVKNDKYLEVRGYIDGNDVGEFMDIILTPISRKTIAKYLGKGLVEIFKTEYVNPNNREVFTIEMTTIFGEEYFGEITPELLADAAEVWEATRKNSTPMLLMKGVLFD